MSAGQPLVDRDMGKLAPQFRVAVEAAIRDCNATGLDVYVFEAMRSAELHALYYARGRTIIPPTRPVTNAKSHLYSWHAYGLAVDCVSRAHGWEPPEAWWKAVVGHFERHGCKWGGHWKQRDLPHFQAAVLKPSPSDRARQLYAAGGCQAVWDAVGLA